MGKRTVVGSGEDAIFEVSIVDDTIDVFIGTIGIAGVSSFGLG